MLMTCPDCQLDCTIDEASIDTYSCPCCGLLLYSKSGGSNAPAPLPATQPPIEESADGLERTRQWQAPLEEILPVPEQLPRRLGRYELVELLGEGSFAHVYRANDSELERDIAIKIPRKQRFTSSGQIARFVDEARTAAKLEHPGIVRVYDIGWLTDDACFIAMEYCVGGSLDKVLKSGKALSFERTAEVMIEVAESMHFAHLKGLVHRDLKPSNIMFGRDGRTRIVDFGLALPEDQQHDRAGEVAGTLPYMSPEQIRGETQHLDGRTDIWSLGIILYQLLAGRRPFAGDKQKLQAEILHREPKPLRQVVQDIPKELEDICLKCLVKSVASRWATAQDIAEALKAWLETRRSTLSGLGSSTQVQPGPASAPPRRTVALLVGLLLLVVGVLGFLPMALSSKSRDQELVRPLAPDWLDKQPLGLQTSLLKHAPEKLYWPKRSPNCTLDANLPEERLNVSTNSRSLVRLGQTNANQFRLDAEIYKTGQSGVTGLFWGYQTDPQDPTRSDCHAVYLKFYHDPRAADRYMITLCRLSFELGARRVSLGTEFEVGEFVDTLRDSGGRLEIIATNNGRLTVYWNGVELKSL